VPRDHCRHSLSPPTDATPLAPAIVAIIAATAITATTATTTYIQLPDIRPVVAETNKSPLSRIPSEQER